MLDKRQNCDLCKAFDLDEFVDGVEKVSRRWANMCMSCYRLRGVGLGVGRGQRYLWSEPNERYLKVEG